MLDHRAHEALLLAREEVVPDVVEDVGHEQVLHYQFSDLDLTAEVDQKKLLVELYDRSLISKSTLQHQQKMGLSPAVEAKQQEGPRGTTRRPLHVRRR